MEIRIFSGKVCYSLDEAQYRRYVCPTEDQIQNALASFPKIELVSPQTTKKYPQQASCGFIFAWFVRARGCKIVAPLLRHQAHLTLVVHLAMLKSDALSL